MKDLYSVLGLKHSATQAEIRKRWKELARKYHPDHNPEDPLSETHFKDAYEAYRVLSDEDQRKRYDQGATDLSWAATQPVHHYFFARRNPAVLKCFEEVALTFTYSGRGKIFKKPEMADFFLTGSPFVSQRLVIHEGQTIRETELTYIVCPLKPGALTIEKASISIENKVFESEPFSVSVLPVKCCFSKGNTADGKPFKLTMHYEYLPGEEPFRMSELKKNHMVLVPRSRTAHVFHKIGSAMKLVGTIWGMIKLNQEFDLNPLLGMAAGNLLAGINCQILYAIAQIKPKFAAPRISSVAKEYLERGYFLGESMGIPMVSGSFWYYLGRIFR